MEKKAIYDLQLGDAIMVSRFITNHEWSFPVSTSTALIDIFHDIPLEIQPHSDFDEEIVWTLEYDGNFTLMSVYRQSVSIKTTICNGLP